MNQSNAVLGQTIHTYCQNVLQMGDFNKKQQLLDQITKFLLDWLNLPIFKILVENDANPQTVFVLYELLQKAMAANQTFLNIPNNRFNPPRNYFEDLEKQKLTIQQSQEKVKYSEMAAMHTEIAINYFRDGKASQHPNYVVNTVIFTIAFMLRKYWSDIINIDDLVDKLIITFLHSQKPLMQQTIGCKLFENLLNCVRQYFYSTGYLEFRKIMIGFQRASLWKILQATHGLIKLHLQNNSFFQLMQAQKPFTESIIALCYQLVSFNFNLSFYELDVDNDSKENSIVNFPDCYFLIVSDTTLISQFFQSIVHFYPHDVNTANQFVFMLQRFACCRLSLFLGKKCKKHFRRAMWDGVNYLLTHQALFIKNPEFCNEVCSLVLRIVNNLTLRKLAKFKDVFDAVANQMSNFHGCILTNLGFKISANNVCIKLQEVWNQLIYQIQLQKPYQDQTQIMVSNLVNTNFSLMIVAIIQGNTFSELPPEMSVKKFKKFQDSNYAPFHTVYQSKQLDCLRNFGELLISLQQPLMQFQTLPGIEQQHLLKKLSSLLSLVSCLVLYNNTTELNTGFDYYPLYQREERPQCELQGKVIHLVLEFIGIANQLVIPANNTLFKVFHMSCMIFIENFMLLTIEGLSYDENLHIVKSSSSLYQALLKDNLVAANYLNILDRLLEKCFHVFTLGDPQLVEQSLRLIEQIYSKVKRQLPRRVFRESSLNSMLKQFFQQLEITCFNQVSYIKKRKLIFKIIAIVWVDDYMDDYIPSLVEIYRQIKQQIAVETNKENMLKYLWDLIGVTEELDVDQIYRIFLRIIYPDLSQLLGQETVSIFAKDYDSSLGLLMLIKSIFYNKNMRLSNENIQLILYQVYGKAINFFIILSDHLTSLPNIAQNNLKQAARLMKVMNEVSVSKQINQGYFLIYGDTVFLDLFKKQLILVQTYRKHFSNYPKYKKIMFELLENICLEQCETLTYRCSIEQYLLIFQLSRDTLNDILKFTQPKGEEQINEEACLIASISSILVHVSVFLIQEALIGHSNDTSMIKNKIQDIIGQAKQIYTDIFEMSYSIITAYPKVQKIQSVAPDIIFVVSLFNPAEFQAQLILLIQQSHQNIHISSQILDLIGQAYSGLDGQIHPQSQQNFCKKIKSVFDALNDKNDKKY